MSVLSGKSKIVLLFTLVTAVSLTAGLLAAKYFIPAPVTVKYDLPAPPALDVPDVRPDFSLPDLEGQVHHINEWNGKTLLINFWATWCPPCIKEIPAFIKLKEDLNRPDFEILGIAIDQLELTQDFVDGYGVNYPILIGEAEGIDIMKAYGNRLGTLPYSIVVDRNGNIIKAFRKEVSKEEVLQVISPLLTAASKKGS
ncbi:MAG: redoxin domain-containing protein [Gammaproteobacteria bacterium]|nr:MAG: redoxin domain-containing protein [Gammaproteobacteria bacterium]